MRPGPLALVAFVTAVSCGGVNNLGGGTGGSAAGTGTAGSSVGGTIGSGGTVGTGGTGVVGAGGDGGRFGLGCTPGDTSAYADMTLLDSDGNLVAAPLAAAVTVASVDSCTMVACPAVAVQPPVNAMETRIVVTAGAQSWTLYLTNTAMPSDLVKVGDAFDMTVQASTDIQYVTSISQTVVLAHGADLVLFAADLSTTLWVLPATVPGGQPPPLPNLNAFGITLVDRGTDCISGCSKSPHGLGVTVGTYMTYLVGQGTIRAGWLSLTSGQFNEGVNVGMCDFPQSDGKPHTRLAGFRAP
jgi:hypothetical protein